jgi:hypothetical protein
MKRLLQEVAVAAGPDEYLAVWQDGPSVSHRTIYGRRVAGDGTTPAPPFLIAEQTNEVCAEPDVAYRGGVGYLVAWVYEGPSTAWDAYGRYVTTGGDMHALDEFSIDLDWAHRSSPPSAVLPSETVCTLSRTCMADPTT